MTNKIPVAGKKYKHKQDGDLLEVSFTEKLEGKNLKIWFTKGTWLYLWQMNDYEELPTANSQKTEEVQVKENIIAEVKGALEELRYGLNNPILDNEVLRYRAKNLINALDDSNPVKSDENKNVGGSDIPENGDCGMMEYSETAEVTPQAMEMLEKLIGKKQVEAEKKEGIEEALAYGQGFSRISADNGKEVIQKNAERFCTLTDFINSFEELQKKVKGMEERLRKLGNC